MIATAWCKHLGGVSWFLNWGWRPFSKNRAMAVLVQHLVCYRHMINWGRPRPQNTSFIKWRNTAAAVGSQLQVHQQYIKCMHSWSWLCRMISVSPNSFLDTSDQVQDSLYQCTELSSLVKFLDHRDAAVQHAVEQACIRMHNTLQCIRR